MPDITSLGALRSIGADTVEELIALLWSMQAPWLIVHRKLVHAFRTKRTDLCMHDELLLRIMM